MAEYNYEYTSYSSYSSYESKYESKYEYEYEETVGMMATTHIEVSNWFDVFGSDTIDYYHARRDFRTVKEWYDMVSTPIDDEKQMRRLESNVDALQMHTYLKEAKDKYEPVDGLTKAECLVVLMYTGDSKRPFFKEYNNDSAERIWEDYRIYTRLLLSALRELGRNRANRPPSDKPLYRGIGKYLDQPEASRIFWTNFTSTSLSLQTAKKFAKKQGIILKFQPPHSRYAVKVGKLSSFKEQEVLIPPFVAFDVIGRDSEGFFVFRTSKTQEFLD